MNIYFIFSATPYRMGKFIRKLTGESYNHISISLDEELTQMYSFARRFYHTPFYGGFVKETLSRYHVNSITANIHVCRLQVTAKQYHSLSQLFSQMIQNEKHYSYNHLSALFSIFQHRVKVQDAYTCVEFCVHILQRLGFPVDTNKYCSIGNLEQLLRPYAVYTGPAPMAAGLDACYYDRKPIPHPFLSTAAEFFSLFKRLKK